MCVCPSRWLFLSRLLWAGCAGWVCCGMVRQALSRSKTLQVNYPIRHGLIENWNNMERLWQRCIFDYLRVEPEEHFFLLVR